MAKTRIPAATIEKIRGRIDLVRLVEESGVALRRSGRESYTGKCPFHQDDSPSFSVSAEKQLYHCFGCGASGTVFTFVSHRENIPYEDAVRKLAARAGVPIAELDETPAYSDEHQITQALRFAREWFHDRLVRGDAGTSAREYLRQRGVSQATINEFQLGFAPDGWDNLLKDMRKNEFKPDVLVKAGLVREREQGGGHYDYFRNRILIPIVNATGELVAFGGRTLGDDKPKYLNSSDSPLYKKSEVLYMLHHARAAIREAGRVLVTEGYFDALTLCQEGVKNIVASCGTSLTDSHARLLKRYTESVVFVFDGDPAGDKGALRGARHFLQEGLRVKVALLPEGSDADSFVREQGADALRNRVEDAVPLVEFLLRQYARDDDLTRAETKATVIRELADLLRFVQSPIFLREYAQMIATELGLHPRDVWSELRRNGVALRTPPPAEDPRRAVQQRPRLHLERRLLSYLLTSPQEIEYVSEKLAPSDLLLPAHQELARILWATAKELDPSINSGQGEFDPRLLMETCYDEEVRELIASLLMEARPLPSSEAVRAEIHGCVLKIVRDTLRTLERQHLEEKLKEGDSDESALAQMLRELTEQRREMEHMLSR